MLVSNVSRGCGGGNSNYKQDELVNRVNELANRVDELASKIKMEAGKKLKFSL